MKILDIQSQNSFSDKSFTIEFATAEQTNNSRKGSLLFYLCYRLDAAVDDMDLSEIEHNNCLYLAVNGFINNKDLYRIYNFMSLIKS